MHKLLDELKGLLGAFFIAILIRTFILQPFVIPSASMYPGLHIGDFLVVTKHTYGYTNYSFPFAPELFQGRVWAGKPERGQVVVFRNPVTEIKDMWEKLSSFNDEMKNADFIKRLIGLPGDRVQLIKGTLHINGTPVKMERIEDYTYQDPRNKAVKTMLQYKETLPNGVSYNIIKDRPLGESPYRYHDDTEEYVVPAGHYFFMGDNRDHSGDSRFMDMVGYVPEDYVIGPARVIFFSTTARWYEPADYLSGIQGDRIMKVIH